MARVALAYATPTVNGSLADPTGTATVAGAGNGLQVPATTGGGSLPELTLLRVSNASGSTGNVVVKAGSQPLAVSSGQGDLTVSLATATTSWVGPFESARFLQNDGSLIIESSVVMTVTAFKVPRH